MENNENKVTVVDRYLVEEVKELIYDGEALDKWVKNREELGLVGQQKLVNKGAKQVSPVPFLFMKKSLYEAITVLCPRHAVVESYDVEPIPLEVLDLIALAKREGYFQEIRIRWDDSDPDPVCVGSTCSYVPLSKGYNGHHEGKQKKPELCRQWLIDNGFEPYSESPYYTTDEKFYLLARWGDMHKSLDELMAKAKNRWLTEQKTQLQLEISKAERRLKDLELEAMEKFGDVEKSDLPF